jgi:hypothetical protein
MNLIMLSILCRNTESKGLARILSKRKGTLMLEINKGLKKLEAVTVGLEVVDSLPPASPFA